MIPFKLFPTVGPLIFLTLKRVEGDNPLPPPTSGFSKNASPEARVKPWLFVTFDITISHILPENFIKVSQVL